MNRFKRVIYFLALAFLFLALAFLCLHADCRNTDPVVAELSGSGSSKIKIRTCQDWECSVPVYLVAVSSDGWHGESTPFLYCDPRIVESEKVLTKIRTSSFDDLFLVWSKEQPDTILAIVDVSNQIVYPSTCWSPSYDNHIDNIMLKIRQFYQNEHVQLSKDPEL